MRARYLHTRRPSSWEELPPFGGNRQLGCGLVVRRIKGHRYLDFWAYEERSWGSYRKWTYVGRVGRSSTRVRAHELLITYHLRAKREVERRVNVLQSAAMAER